MQASVAIRLPATIRRKDYGLPRPIKGVADRSDGPAHQSLFRVHELPSSAPAQRNYRKRILRAPAHARPFVPFAARPPARVVDNVAGPPSGKNPEIEPNYMIHRFGDLPAALEFFVMYFHSRGGGHSDSSRFGEPWPEVAALDSAAADRRVGTSGACRGDTGPCSRRLAHRPVHGPSGCYFPA